MLKRWDSTYQPGRPKGPWFKWKRDPFLVDAVLMYAQRGHGKRSSYYSDYTFGVWRDGAGGAELVPVGKAYFGFTDEELKKIDKFVRDNTIERFGPVRSVRAGPLRCCCQRRSVRRPGDVRATRTCTATATVRANTHARSGSRLSPASTGSGES